jgi:hypothetical protein
LNDNAAPNGTLNSGLATRAFRAGTPFPVLIGIEDPSFTFHANAPGMTLNETGTTNDWRESIRFTSWDNETLDTIIDWLE